MKFHPSLVSAAFSLLVVVAGSVLAAEQPASLIYETADEFFGSGDFDGDGRNDLVIVDKQSGKYRLGYQLSPGVFSWVDNRPSEMKNITGLSIGHLIATN